MRRPMLLIALFLFVAVLVLPQAAFEMDYDTQRDFLKAHVVRWQSTIIVFEGAQKKAAQRAVWTSRASGAFMERAL